MKKFPEDFFWGAATSSHQVEGYCINDWSEWEKRNASRLAADYSNLPDIASGNCSNREGCSAENYISGRAVDHHNRFETDFELAEKIGLNAYRFSIEWSRIEPEEGKWNEDEINYYRRMIKSLREKKIEPFVTIWHWALPLWLAKSGGLLNPVFPLFFSRYSSKLAGAFGTEVNFYITINEPEIYSLNGYMLGKWPPQKRGLLNYYKAIKSLIKSHILSYDKIKKINPACSIGPACNMTCFESGGGVLNSVAVSVAEKFWNRYFIDKIKPRIDFIGLNYYFHNRIKYGLNRNFNERISDMGWELYPEGIYHLLIKLKNYRLPVYITENGLADADDRNREWFLKETLNSVYNSIQNGADVRGYFHWSLLDNFEWDKGFWPKFGLISVDRKTMKRNIRGSADIYSRIIRMGLE